MDSFVKIENAWLEPSTLQEKPLYICEWCDEAICCGDSYIEIAGLMICTECLDSLSAREMAVEVLNHKIIVAEER